MAKTKAKEEKPKKEKKVDEKKDFSDLPKSYLDRLNKAIENRKQRKDAAKANSKAGQGLEGKEG
jgi:hypothetical protein